MQFRIYKFSTPTNTLAVECGANDGLTPFAWRDALANAERVGYATGTRFRLNDWYFAEVA